jgi:hypothetical protein
MAEFITRRIEHTASRQMIRAVRVLLSGTEDPPRGDVLMIRRRLTPSD